MLVMCVVLAVLGEVIHNVMDVRVEVIIIRGIWLVGVAVRLAMLRIGLASNVSPVSFPVLSVRVHLSVVQRVGKILIQHRYLTIYTKPNAYQNAHH